MTLDDVKKQWRVKLDCLRDERDFCNKHEFRLEALAISRTVEAIYYFLDDLDRLGDESEQEAP